MEAMEINKRAFFAVWTVIRDTTWITIWGISSNTRETIFAQKPETFLSPKEGEPLKHSLSKISDVSIFNAPGQIMDTVAINDVVIIF